MRAVSSGHSILRDWQSALAAATALRDWQSARRYDPIPPGGRNSTSRACYSPSSSGRQPALLSRSAATIRHPPRARWSVPVDIPSSSGCGQFRRAVVRSVVVFRHPYSAVGDGAPETFSITGQGRGTGRPSPLAGGGRCPPAVPSCRYGLDIALPPIPSPEPGVECNGRPRSAAGVRHVCALAAATVRA